MDVVWIGWIGITAVNFIRTPRTVEGLRAAFDPAPWPLSLATDSNAVLRLRIVFALGFVLLTVGLVGSDKATADLAAVLGAVMLLGLGWSWRNRPRRPAERPDHGPESESAR